MRRSSAAIFCSSWHRLSPISGLRDNFLSAVLSQLFWRLVAGAFTIASIFLLSTALGLSAQGIVATSLAAMAVLSLLVGGGFPHGIAYLFAQRMADGGRSLVTWVAILGSGVGAGVGAAAALLAPQLLSFLPVFWWSVALALPFFQLGQLGLGLYQGLGDSRRYSLVMTTPPVVMFACTAVAVSSRGAVSTGSVTPWLTLIIVAPFVAQALAVIVGILRLEAGQMRGHLKGELFGYTARIYPSTLAHYVIYRLDLLMIASILGAGQAGLYSLAIAVVDAVARLAQSVATLMYPRAARMKGLIQQSVGRAAFNSAVASLLLAVTASAAIWLAGTAARRGEWIVVALLTALLTVGAGAIAAWTVFASFLAARGHLAATTRVNFAVLPLSVGLYALLIPAFGLVGGAAATTLSYFMAAVLGYREFRGTGSARR